MDGCSMRAAHRAIVGVGGPKQCYRFVRISPCPSRVRAFHPTRSAIKCASCEPMEHSTLRLQVRHRSRLATPAQLAGGLALIERDRKIRHPMHGPHQGLPGRQPNKEVRGERGDAWAVGPWRRPQPPVCVRCGPELRSEVSVAIRPAQGGCSAAPTGIQSPDWVPCLVPPAASARPATGCSPPPGAPNGTCPRSTPPAGTGLGSGTSCMLRLARHGLNVQ